MTREEALELIERMAFLPTIQAPNKKVLVEIYQASADSDDPVEWVKVVKSCYTREHYGGPALTGEEKMHGDAAKEKLEHKLGEALGLEKEAVEEYVIKYLAENV